MQKQQKDFQQNWCLKSEVRISVLTFIKRILGAANSPQDLNENGETTEKKSYIEKLYSFVIDEIHGYDKYMLILYNTKDCGCDPTINGYNV